MLLSDRGLDEETPESDAHDLTEAERTSLGEVDEIIAGPVVDELEVGETGKDVEHFVSITVSLLLAEIDVGTFEGEENVPFSRAGRMFVSVRCDDDWSI